MKLTLQLVVVVLNAATKDCGTITEPGLPVSKRGWEKKQRASLIRVGSESSA